MLKSQAILKTVLGLLRIEKLFALYNFLQRYCALPLLGWDTDEQTSKS